MKAPEWQQLRRLFHAALERPEEERSAFIEEASADDPERLEALRRLLQRSSETLPGPLDEPFATLVSEVEPEPAPGVLLGGRYALDRRLGSGGMGIVYLAHRADGEYSGRVAIKVLRPELSALGLERRLRDERQILAALQHPNIARLLDGDTTPDGRPFLVMEYVEGEPIDRYCDHRRLGLEARLELFRTVCEVVHFAHQNLVVHRDLKPGNILVTAEGEPKLLDFGIAKLMPPGSAATVTATAVGLTPMTLEYASPEQLRSERVTTASDVYALGVLLYELLVGTRPFRLSQQSLDELVRAVSEEPPMPLSRVLLEGTQDGASVAQSRGTEMRSLRQRLAGDLETIALKALHKAPERRYASADELARDVERHLRGLPVQARRDTLVYRFGKLVRRHPWIFAALTLAFLGLLLFTALLVREQRETRLQWRRAEAVVAFLQDTLRLPDVEFDTADARFLSQVPEERRGAQVPLREILDQAARELPTLEDGLLRADLAATLGEVYRRLGLYDAAEPLLGQALEDRRRLRGPRHPEIAHSLILQADLHFDKERLQAAAAGYGEALEILHQTGGAEKRPDLFYAALTGQGRLAVARSDLVAAAGLRQHTLDLAREVWGEQDPRFAESLLALAELRRQEDAVPAAEDLADRALEAFQRAFPQPGGHPRLAAARVSLGLLAERSGDLNLASEHLLQALDMRRDLYGDDHPAVADALHALAGVERRMPGGQAAAEESCREALRIFRAVYGLESSSVASALNLQGILRSDGGDFVAAEALHRRAFELWHQTVGEKHPLVASAHSNLARALHGQGRFEDSERAYGEALNRYRRAYGEEHFQVVRALINLAGVQLDWRRERTDPVAAEANLQRALAILGPEPNHPDLPTLYIQLALVFERQGRHAEAAEQYRSTWELLEPRANNQHQPFVSAWLGLGRAERALGRGDAVVKIAEEILAFLDEVEGETEHLRLSALSLLLDGLISTENYSRAEAVLQEFRALGDHLDSAAARARASERAALLERRSKGLDP